MQNSHNRDEYLRRIHAVQDYIEEHADTAPDLAELAEAARFSKYHFHRIFRALSGETLLQYVCRIKMERAGAYLVHSPHVTVTDIAYHYGFSDSAVFSRSFKSHFGVSPTAFRSQHRKNCKDGHETFQYTEGVQNQPIGRDTMNAKATGVELTTLDLRVIYIRHTGSYRELGAVIPGILQRLYVFAMGQKLLDPAQTKILSVYHDNPDLTDEAQLRVSLCMTISKTAKVEEKGEIGTMSISGSYAVGHFELKPMDYGAAWQYMYGEWLPNSGYQPRDTFPFEVYVSDPSQNPGGNQLLDVCLPVEPLGNI
jgi:AraC family transcriptional regulator